MKFIDNWKSMWQWISFQCFALLLAGHGAPMLLSTLGFQSAGLDAIAQQHTYAISIVTIVLAVLGIFGLTIQQDSLPDWLPWKIKYPPAQSVPAADGGVPPSAPASAPPAKSQEATP